MTPTLPQALARLEGFFADKDSRAGLMGRRLLGVAKPDDAQLATLLCQERRSRTRFDGSVGGALVYTAWAAWELMDLGLEAVQGGLSRLVSWVVTFLEGKPLVPVAIPLALPNGTVLTNQVSATFAAECLGLRLLLRAGEGDRPGVLRRLERVLSLLPTLPNDLAACALSVVAVSPVPYRDRLPACVARVAASQRPDGTWSDADLLHMLESLVLAGIRPVQAVIDRAVPPLLGLQRPDGSFDDPPHEERALIGLRALLVAQEA